MNEPIRIVPWHRRFFSRQHHCAACGAVAFDALEIAAKVKRYYCLNCWGKTTLEREREREERNSGEG